MHAATYHWGTVQVYLTLSDVPHLNLKQKQKVKVKGVQTDEHHGGLQQERIENKSKTRTISDAPILSGSFSVQDPCQSQNVSATVCCYLKLYCIARVCASSNETNVFLLRVLFYLGDPSGR